MGLTTKSILLCCDDPDLTSKVLTTLKPVVKQVVPAASGSEAWSRMVQPFDCILYRTKVAKLSDPNELFACARKNKSYKDIPWVVLGSDIEDPKIAANHPQLKFLAKAEDDLGLLRLLDEVCKNGPEDDAPAPETADGKLDARIINSLVGSVVDMVKDLSGIQLKRGTPLRRKPSDSCVASGDISSLIPMSSDRFKGSFSICFQEPLVSKIHLSESKKQSKPVDSNIKTFVGDLTTRIFGHVQQGLGSLGYKVASAAPRVFSGKGHEIPHSPVGVRFAVPFESEFGNCIVECVIEIKK